MSVLRTVPYHYYIYGNDSLYEFWSHVFGTNGWVGEHWTIRSLPFYGQNNAAYVDMSLNVQYVDSRDNDRLTLTDPVGTGSRYVLNIKGVEHIDAPVSDEVHLEIVGKVGFTTDGSLDSLRMNVGHHTMVYTGATRDQTLFMGSGWDTVQLVDHPDVGATQYWSVIRRADGEIDAYSLYSGNRIRMQEGSTTWDNTNGRVNYGEVDEIQLASRLRAGGDVFLTGKNLSGTQDRGTFDNIDLSVSGVGDYSDRFNSASFKSINYATTNVYKGTAVVETFAGDTVTGRQASIVDHITSNGIHYLIVEQQTVALDGHFRLYVRDNTSGLYNRFNEVFLGDSGADSNSNTYISTSKNAYATDTLTGAGADKVLGTAMYGFDGNDVLISGANVDYLFGGRSTYSTIVTANNLGNQLTGGDREDYFGVGNISAGADADNIMDTNFSARLSGSAPLSSSDSGKLARSDVSDSADLATRVATDRITDWTAGVDYLRVLANGTAIIEGLGTANGGGGGYFADAIGSDAERIDVSGERVINEGKIVARGLGGGDTLVGSGGDDWLYGNAATNYYTLGSGGNDRVFVDQFDGSRSKHYVTGFTRSSGTASERDLVMLNKRIIDAFYSAGSGRTALKLDVDANYASGQAKSSGVNYLYNNFYSGSYSATNATHDAADGGAFWEGGSGADGTSSYIGLGMAIAGRGMFAIPFVGPIIGAAMIAASIPIEGLGFDPSPTREHRNATYDGTVNAYVNVLADSYGGNQASVDSTVGVDNTNIRFLDFFGGSNTGDGYLPVVEFTAHSGQSIYGYFALHSDDETFVFLVASMDNMVENAEALFVAEINGRLTAADFGIYDGEQDIYNYSTIPAVVIRTPTVTKVADSATPTADEAQVDGLLADVQNPILISGTVSGTLEAGSYFRVYDGPNKIYDGESAVSGQQVTLGLSGTNFTFTDSRALGTTVVNTTDTSTPTVPDTDPNDTFALSDAYVRYTVELIDGETGLPTRVSVRDIRVSGGNATIDGGNGSDILLVTETSPFLNAINDVRLVGMERIVLAGAVTIVNTVEVPTPISINLSNQSEGFDIVSGSAGDTIVASSGNDVIYGVGGADSILAGNGADTVVYSTAYKVVTTSTANGETNTTTNDIVSTAAASLAADLTVDGGDGVDTLQFDTDRYEGSTRVFSPSVVLTDAEFQKVTRFENLVLNGTGPQTVTLGANANAAFATGITVTTVATAISLNFDASNVDWTRTTHVTGTNNADTITGGSGNDTLIGLGGADTITAGSGNDSLSGGDDADTFVLVGNLTSADTIGGGDGGTNSDTLTFTDANGAADDLNNVTGIETITLGNTTTNVVVTTVDSLVASGATLTVNASSLTTGTLTWTGSAETNGKFSITGGGAADTIIGGAGNDTINGGVGADSITAGTGNDNLSGGDDADTFVLGGNLTSADTISGGDGGTNSDTLTFTDTNGAADDLNNVTGIETITLGNTTTSVVVTTVDALVASGATLTVNASSLSTGTLTWTGSAETNGAFSITGGGAADTIIGGAGNDTINGGLGADSITGGTGNDSLLGDGGDDLFVFNHTNTLTDADAVSGGEHTTGDTVRVDLTGTVGFTLDGDFTGIETLVLNDQSDDTSGATVTLAAAYAQTALTINGSTMDAGQVLTLDASANSASETVSVTAGSGDDVVAGGAANDTLSGGDGKDSITGGAGADSLTGNAGIDTLLGDAGDDTLIGGDGADVLWAGPGADLMDGSGETINAVDRLIVVGDLSTADATKLALINTTLNGFLGYVPGLTNTHATSDVASGGSLVFDSSGNDELHAFGTVDLTGVMITGTFVAHSYSTLTLTQSQLGQARQINLVGTSSHTIIVTDNNGNALSNAVQQAAIDNWMNQSGAQVGFTNSANRFTVGGRNYDYEQNGGAFTAEDIKGAAVGSMSVSSLAPDTSTWGFTPGDDGNSSTSSGDNVNGNTSQLIRNSSGNFGSAIFTNADDSFSLISIPNSMWSNGIELNGVTYTNVYLGTNGYVTFGAGSSSYVPTGLPGSSLPMIAGQYDDLYPGANNGFSGSGSGTSTNTNAIYYYSTASSMVFTFDNVSTYSGVSASSDGGLRSAFQIILHKPSGDAASEKDFGIEIRYEEVAIQSSGATAGWTAGNGVDYGLVNPSKNNLYLVGPDQSNVGVTGVWAWTVEGGTLPSTFLIMDVGSGNTKIASGAVSGFTPTAYTVTGEFADQFSITGSGTSFEAQTAAGSTFYLWKDVLVDGIASISLNATAAGSSANKSIDVKIVSSGLDPVSRSGTTLTVTATSNALNAATDGDITITAVTAATAAAAVTLDLSNQSEALSITGSAYDDTITGGSDADTISGGNGNDKMIVSGSADASYDGGLGSDTLSVTSDTSFTGLSSLTSIETILAADGVDLTFDAARLTGQTITVTGTGDNAGETLSVNGTASAETIDLSGLTLDTNDIAGVTITGGAGADTITGTNGADRIVVAGTSDMAAGESYDGGLGSDTLSVTSDTSFIGLSSLTSIETILAADGVDLTFAAARLTGQTIAMNGTGDNGGETLSVVGTNLADTINLSGLTLDTNDFSGATIDAGAGNDTITGTNGADTILGGDGTDVYRYTTTSQTAVNNVVAQMDYLSGFNVVDDSIDLSALGTISGLTATVDASDPDSYIVQWTSGSPNVTNYVYLKDTGVTGGLTLTNNGGIVTAAPTTATALALTLVSVSSTGFVTQGDGPHRAYFTIGNTPPVRNDTTTYYTQSTNVGASTDYTFSLADIDASDAVVRVGHVAIQSTNTGINTYLNARVYIGGAAGADDPITANITGGLTTLNFAIVYGQDGNDALTGSTGNDYLFGGNGSDTIVGAAGSDYLHGGAGTDLFSFTAINSSTDRDTVGDFAVADDDIGLDVDLTGVGTAANLTAAFAEHAFSTSKVGNNPLADYLLGLATDTYDVIEFTGLNQSRADLSTATDGSELLKMFHTTSSSSITSLELGGSTGSGAVYFVGYDNGKAYLYLSTSTDKWIQAGEISLIGTFDAITSETLTSTNFVTVL